MRTRKLDVALAHADTVVGDVPGRCTVVTAIIKPQAHLCPRPEVTIVDAPRRLGARKVKSFVISAEQLISMADSGEFERADAPHPAVVCESIVGWSDDEKYYLSVVNEETK